MPSIAVERAGFQKLLAENAKEAKTKLREKEREGRER